MLELALVIETDHHQPQLSGQILDSGLKAASTQTKSSLKIRRLLLFEADAVVIGTRTAPEARHRLAQPFTAGTAAFFVLPSAVGTTRLSSQYESAVIFDSVFLQ